MYYQKFLILLLASLFSFPLVAKGPKYYVYSFETKKRGKHALAIVANINHVDDCLKSIGKYRRRLSQWRYNQKIKSRLVLLTVVINKETLKECQNLVAKFVKRDSGFKSTIRALDFDVTIVEKKPKPPALFN